VKTNSVTENRQMWNDLHGWPADGDEWVGQARRCGQPYPEWKQALVDRLITPYAAPGSTVLEIAPGHGRWTEFLVQRAGRLILVDLSPRCLDFCRERFAAQGTLEYHTTDGSSLPAGLDGQVDLVWSFDAVVHIAAPEIAGYLRDIHRVLKPGGQAVLHHANRRHATLGLGWLRRLGTAGRRLYRALSLGTDEWDDGWRSDVSAELFARLARQAGLTVVEQFGRWGEGDAFGVPRYNDRVSILAKPLGAARA